MRSSRVGILHGKFGENVALWYVRSLRFALSPWYTVGRAACLPPQEPHTRLCISPCRKPANGKHHTILKKSAAFPRQRCEATFHIERSEIFHTPQAYFTFCASKIFHCESSAFPRQLMRSANCTFHEAKHLPPAKNFVFFAPPHTPNGGVNVKFSEKEFTKRIIYRFLDVYTLKVTNLR